MNADAIVVGAGPAGLTAAVALIRQGLRVRVIDSAAGPAGTSRAIAMHARTLETYDQLGLADELHGHSLVTDAFSMHRKGRRMVRFGPEYSELPTRYPFTLLIEQTSTERVLRDALEKQDVHVEWGTRLDDLDELDDGVLAHVKTPDGTAGRIRATWLIGCDGGHSTVRKLLGIPLIGDSSETWLISDAVVDMDVPRDSLHWLQAGTGTVMAVPLPGPGRWRLLDTVDVDDGPGVTDRFEAKLSAGFGTKVKVCQLDWVSVFTIQQRMVPTMRSGRCFVAGDAAHVHSPASGQGMNTGIQDAVNLAWKLAMVTRGLAHERLLDSYSAERVPIGRALLTATSKATAIVALKSALAAAAMPPAFTVIRNVPTLRHRIERKVMRGMTGLAIAYPDSPLTTQGPAGPGPRPGERLTQVTRERAAGSAGWREILAQLRDPRWTLLTFDPWQAPAEHSSWLCVHAPEDPDGSLRADLGGGWLLIRPDGYLTARGTGTPVLPDLLGRAA
jgi:NADPH-dependent dioxygenase